MTFLLRLAILSLMALLFINSVLSNISPIKERRVALESSERTKNRCLAKALQCLSAACETICPGEGSLLKSMVCQSISQETQFVPVNETSKILVDIYNSADSWTFRRQILSILTENHSYQDMKQVYPTKNKCIGHTVL